MVVSDESSPVGERGEKGDLGPSASGVTTVKQFTSHSAVFHKQLNEDDDERKLTHNIIDDDDNDDDDDDCDTRKLTHNIDDDDGNDDDCDTRKLTHNINDDDGNDDDADCDARKLKHNDGDGKAPSASGVATMYRAVRKFPSHSAAFHKQQNDNDDDDCVARKLTFNVNDDDDDGDDDNDVNANGHNPVNRGDTRDTDEEEDEDGDDVEAKVDGDDDGDDEEEGDDNDVSVESGETLAKKLKLSEDAETLKNIFMTEDFINFLCYRSYNEPEDANEQRRIVADFFKEENSHKSDSTGETSKPAADFNKKSMPPIKEELAATPRSYNPGPRRESTMKRKLSTSSGKSLRTLSWSPNKNTSSGEDCPSLKSRLRPSTKASTAATDKEQLLNAKRRLSQELQLSELSKSSSEKEVEPDSSEKDFSFDDQEYHPGSEERCTKLKFITATAGDFSDIHDYIARLINSRSQPAFLVQPPHTFKVECNISQHVRFSTHNQYVHRFFNRWGRNSIQLACITYFLDSHDIGFTSHPLAGGIEMDLVGLSDAICKHGGLQKVIDDVLWSEVIGSMRVPKMTRDKISRFYEVYCRYLLSYDLLSSKEKQKLEKKVLTCSDSDCCDDLCVSKGRCRTLSELYDVACNIASVFDLDDAPSRQVSSTYWKIVQEASPHVTVHTAFIKPSDISKRRLSNRNKTTLASHLRCCNSSSCPIFCDEDVLDSRLEVEMMFSTRCWTTDRHVRGTLTYNHTGADIIWYFVSGHDDKKLKRALKTLVPDLIDQTSGFWLPPNTVMVHPNILIQHGVPVSCVVQKSGQLLIIPPHTFFSSISCGYNISERIHFLPHNWLPSASKAFSNLHKSCQESMFSMEKFVFVMLSVECFHQHHHHHLNPTQHHHHHLNPKQHHHHHLNPKQHHLNPKQHLSTMQISEALTLMEGFVSQELKLRKALVNLGVRRRLERVIEGEERGSDAWVGKIIKHQMDVCHLSKDFCFFSVVKETKMGIEYCLECSLKKLLKKDSLDSYELILHFTQSELSEIVSQAKKFWNVNDL